MCTMNFINEILYVFRWKKLSDPFSKPIHEFQGFAPTTTEYIYLFNVRLIAQENYSIFHYRGKISKINCFECVGFGEMLC